MLKNLLILALASIVSLVCVIPLFFAAVFLGIPVFREWQVRQSIVVPEGAKLVLVNTRPQTGGISQRHLYYWSPHSVTYLIEYYQQFTSPFTEVVSHNESWIIAAWNTSKTLEPTARGIYTHNDLCNYREIFYCITVTIIDNRQPSAEITMQLMFGLSDEQLESIVSDGSIVIFTYTVPEPA